MRSSEPIVSVSEDQLSDFDRNGYLKIPQAIPPTLLKQMSHALDRYIHLGLDQEDHSDYARISHGPNTFIATVNNICKQANHEVLALLGCPEIQYIMDSICGPDCLPMQDFAVIKHRGYAEKVDWHQDMILKREYRNIRIGIYLDPASSGEGALEVLPGSQVSEQDICKVSKQELPTHTIDMLAGDVLIHDVMTVHRSGLLTHQDIRRVIYFECLSVQQVHNSRLYSREIINRRLALKSLAQEYYHHRNAFEIASAILDIYKDPLPPSTAHFCQDR